MDITVAEKVRELSKNTKRTASAMKDWLNGNEKKQAAVVLGFLPLEDSKKIIELLEGIHKEILVKEITRMPKYNPEVIEEILISFIEKIQEKRA